MGAGAFDVVAAVADHDGRIGGEAGSFEGGDDDLVLVHAAAVELTADDGVEGPGQTEVVEDASGEDRRLRGRQDEAAVFRERFEQLGDARVELVLEDARVGEVGPVVLDGALRAGVVEPEVALEGLLERRADEVAQRRLGQRIEPERADRELDGARDAEVRIGERPVEIEEDWLVAQG